MKKVLLGLASGALLVFAIDASTDAKAWWAHVAFLADDALEGRKAGTEGYRKAVAYVSEQFHAAGLKPAGTHSYSQPVEFKQRLLDETQSTLQLVQGRRTQTVQFGTEANLGRSGKSGALVEAEAVFVGYGLVVPEAGIDDLKGLDLKGKIAVYLSGAPKSLPGALAAHAQSAAERWKGLRAAGVVGVASTYNPRTNDVPWERSTLTRLRPSLTLSEPALVDTDGLQVSVGINPAVADIFLAGSGHTIAELLALDNAARPLPKFPLALKIRAKAVFSEQTVISDNVVGVLPGSDPRLNNEYVAVSAHLDHLGTGQPIEGDGIYNGAMDNASGIASLIESAKLLNGRKQKRSVLFLACTGEESGLLGSRFFAAHPSVPASSIVADINMDMYLPIIPLKAVVVLGLEESDLGPEFAKVAQQFGVETKRDPEPERRLFTRSDQYSFIRRGIPALAFKFYAQPGSPEDQLMQEWRHKRYHSPTDDLQQPVDREGAAKFTQLLAAMIADVANRNERPTWNESSFFRRFAEKP